MQSVLHFLKGYVKLKICSEYSFRFFNQCRRNNIYLWNIRCEAESCTFYMYLRDFYRIKPVVKSTKIKVVLCARYGLPFLLHKMIRRKAFLLGAILTVWLWLYSETFLWEIQIDGNVSITDEMILDHLSDHSVFPGIRLSNIDIHQTESDMRGAFPPITWLSIKQQGTGLLIELKENDTLSYEADKELTANTGIHSPVDGIIQSMIVRSGNPMVHPGDRVTDGQLLIDWRIPLTDINGNPASYGSAVADGDIRIRCDLPYEFTLPGICSVKQYTGRTVTVPYLLINRKEYLFPWNSPYQTYDVVKEESTYGSVPFTHGKIRFGTCKLQEYYISNRKYQTDEIKELMKTELQKNICNLEEKGVQIIEKNVKIYKSASLYVARGSITVDLPVPFPASFARD